jgi:transcriptional regulator with XRE-family HTH domain
MLSKRSSGKVQYYLTETTRAHTVATVKDDKAFYEALGRRLERHRSAKNMTQAELGACLTPQLTRAAISNMEKGRQGVLANTLCHIADILGVQLTDLVPPRENRPVGTDLKKSLESKLPKGAADVFAKTIARSKGRAA